MGFKTTRHVDYNGKPHPAGKPIKFTADEEGAKARNGLLALVPPAIEGNGADAPGAKPLDKINKEELRAVAEAEEVELPDGATVAQMIEAIKAKRAEQDGDA